jgi:hypothetical protein
MRHPTLVYDADLDALVPKYGRNRHNTSEKRADHLASPAVHPGGMPEIKSMADGKRYETRRNYYRSVARAGCEIVGFDKREDIERHTPKPGMSDKQLEQAVMQDTVKAWEIEAGKVPSYGPEARRLMRKQRRAERATKA